ncbi:MAG: homoserine dehydrogenase [Propionibacteriaceae bacterium]|jgi:homoserine dehydrogenase|nr:homoserine dehydrogenase [Propionibacteriaceae bacterium]
MSERSANAKPLRIALLGCGTVGSQVARLLLTHSEEIAQQIGGSIELIGIAVRSTNAERPGIPHELLTADAMGLVVETRPDIVIELLGAPDTAESLIRAALLQGSGVVTANKALLGRSGRELFVLAQRWGADLFFEAAVAGAVPIVRALRESLVADDITSVVGIVNGTTNFIIEQMATRNVAFDVAFAQAQRLGYVEEDPTADIAGYDAASKAALLASLAFHTWVDSEQVYREGITNLTPADFQAARSINCVIKLLAVAQLSESGQLNVRVHPALLPVEHMLASVSGGYNAIFLQTTHAGRLAFFGAGAGGEPTATAVISDVIAVGRNRLRGVTAATPLLERNIPVQDITAVSTHYYLRFAVADVPGILAQVGEVFVRRNISVRALNQVTIDSENGEAQLGVLTHAASEADIQACVQELSACSFVAGEVRVLRAEGIVGN